MNLAIVGIVLALWLIGLLASSANAIRILFLSWRIPTTWISALPAVGWVSVFGKARSSPILSLLTKTSCAYWQLEVKEYQSGGRGGGYWRTIHKESSGQFEIDDMTGRIKILDRNSQMILSNESLIDRLDANTRSFLENLGIKTKGFLGFDKRMRVYERIIAPETEVLVLGKVQKAENSLMDTPGSIVPTVISNLPKADMVRAVFGRSLRSTSCPS